MNLESPIIVEITLSVISGLAIVGFTVLRLAMRSMEIQNEVTQQLIEHKFQWAESRREESRQYWEKHFDELKKANQDVSQRIHTLETRVMTIELHLASDRKERRISLKKDPALSGDD